MSELFKKVAGIVFTTFIINSLNAQYKAGTLSTPENIYDVREYGAAGDGKTYEGSAIQKAIDACTQNGGDVVLFNKGVFVSGGIMLKNNVDVYSERPQLIL